MRNHIEIEGFVHRVTQFGKNKDVIRLKLENEIKAIDGSNRVRKNWLDCVIFGATKKLYEKLNHGKKPHVKFEGLIQSSTFNKEGVRHYRQDIVIETETLEFTAN